MTSLQEDIVTEYLPNGHSRYRLCYHERQICTLAMQFFRTSVQIYISIRTHNYLLVIIKSICLH